MSKTIWVIIFQDFKILISDTATILAENFFEGWDISYLKVTSIGMFQVKTQFWVSPSQITHFEPSHLKIVFLCISYEYRYSRASANTGHERVIFAKIYNRNHSCKCCDRWFSKHSNSTLSYCLLI